jgi:adenosylcobyric acid synthase
MTAGSRGALMVCGTTSDAGKSTVVAGLCRLLARRGVSVAPFKGQNMSNNSWVTIDGGEIGRSTAAQAMAAGVEPEVTMNPVLLKPTSDRHSQVVVLGRPVVELDAAAYHRRKTDLLPVVLEALADLRSRFDVVLLEGAGSPAEINLLERDVVNLPLARAAGGIPAIVVGDIERGGVFAQLAGTVLLLPDDLRRLVRAFVVNRMRGDPALLGDGFAELERRCGVPTIGVLPHLGPLLVDAEDSLALERMTTGDAVATLDVAVLRFPRISNFTDLEPLVAEPGVAIRWVQGPAQLGRPDLVVLPGTKATVADLQWLRTSGLDDALRRLVAEGTVVLGICGGYQMLGRSIDDPVESGAGRVAALGLLPADTVFAPTKVTRRRRGAALACTIEGYQIHHGVVRADGDGWIELDGEDGPVCEGSRAGSVFGTTLHGLFENDGFRSAFLASVAEGAGRSWTPSGRSFAERRQAEVDRVADALEAHLDLDHLFALIEDSP